MAQTSALLLSYCQEHMDNSVKPLHVYFPMHLTHTYTLRGLFEGLSNNSLHCPSES